MAAADRPPVAFAGSDRAAARLVHERFGSTLPIPVDEILFHFADVEFVDIPGSVDGLVVDLHQIVRERRRVLVQRSASHVRRRFTMAHELGHIAMSWHLGISGCHVSRNPDTSTDSGREEFQANEFASELLMPTAYLRELVRSGAPLHEAVEQVASEADVSGIAAMIAMSAVYDAGWVWVCVDRHTHKVKHAGRTSGTPLQLPQVGDVLDWHQRARRAESHHTFELGSYRFELIRFAPRIDGLLRPEGNLKTLYKSLLRAIGDDLDVETEVIQSLKHAASGEISASYRGYEGGDAAVLAALIVARFAARDDLCSILDHPLFERFLAARSYELIDRRTQP